jgi:hypothetical protein
MLIRSFVVNNILKPVSIMWEMEVKNKNSDFIREDFMMSRKQLNDMAV